MSQRKVYDLVRSLGGEATTPEIKEAAIAEYPRASLHKYATNRLNSLEGWGFISKHESEDGPTVWRIEREWE